ncbi:MAG: hypothetical protein H6825_16415 [Planctomycetes bacterium]|nr:hypothetical protein [Planctomycetota bacterium]
MTLAAAPDALAGGVDFIVGGIQVTQAVQNGATPLAGGRSTFVRATIRPGGATGPIDVDGIMHVFVDGVEIAGSPIYSVNGPFAAKPITDLGVLDDTLNFTFIPPESANVVITVTVNPPGPNFVAETNTANNTRTSPPLNFQHQKVPEIAYSPIDYRPSGGGVPNLPPEELIVPGVGDNFVQGIYPSSDWYYHRTDAPSKLWTSSLASSGSSLLNSLVVDQALMVPVPDYVYGWVPGGLSYNGQSIINGTVGMGNTQNIRHQRTFAHELGHDFGLQHNTSTTNLVGIDVEHHLNITESLPQLKAASLKDIMYAGLLTQEAWVSASNYNYFFNHATFNEPGGFATDPGGPALMLTGLLDRAAGTLSLGDALVLPQARPSEPCDPAEADLLVRAFADGQLVLELPLATRSSLDACGECRGELDGDASGDSNGPLPETGFTVKLPAFVDGHALDHVSIVTRNGPSASLELVRSAHAPVAEFVSPAGQVVKGAPLHVAWEASDLDGDALQFFLRYSPDGVRMVPLATGTSVSELDVDLGQLPDFVSGQGFFELLASDGLRTTTVRSEPLVSTGVFSGGTVGNAPWIEIMTPDDGKSGLYGATVILHSSGWDLEDRQIGGASIEWSSDLDGPIGTGRHTSTATLSVGTHVITATATDSDGNQTADTTTYTVLARDLPSSGETCQTDLGFGGAPVLSICGGDLSTGSSADLLLTNAPASTPAYFVLSFTNGSVPLFGGTLVPFPLDLVVGLSTDGAGEIAIPGIPGGGGPISVYVQFLVADGGTLSGWDFSNALQVDYLP